MSCIRWSNISCQVNKIMNNSNYLIYFSLLCRCAHNEVLKNPVICRKSTSKHDDIELDEIQTQASTSQTAARQSQTPELEHPRVEIESFLSHSKSQISLQRTESQAKKSLSSHASTHLSPSSIMGPSLTLPSQSSHSLAPSPSFVHISPTGHATTFVQVPSTTLRASSPSLPSHLVHLTEPPAPTIPQPISPKSYSTNPPPPSPAVRLQEFFDDERESLIAASHRVYAKLSEWIRRKDTHRTTRMATEQHAKGVYGVWTERDNQDVQATRRKLNMLARRIGGSLEEGRSLLAEESGYSSPIISSQPTPTANRRIIPPALRRSLELYPRRNPAHPRMSLPCDSSRGPVDGRYSLQATEKRSRLIREKRVSQEDEPGFKFETGRRRLSKPGSWSREGSTGEESGFEEEEPVTSIYIPPSVIEERRDSGSSNGPSVGPDQAELFPEWVIQWDQLRFGNLIRKGATSSIHK